MMRLLESRRHNSNGRRVIATQITLLKTNKSTDSELDGRVCERPPCSTDSAAWIVRLRFRNEQESRVTWKSVNLHDADPDQSSR